MATLAYSFVERCEGGGHTTFDVSLNGGAAQRIVYETDDIRAALNTLTQADRERLALLVLKLHFAGRTRQQIITELNSGPVTVTI